jgi:hypothetical protein
LVLLFVEGWLFEDGHFAEGEQDGSVERKYANVLFFYMAGTETAYDDVLPCLNDIADAGLADVVLAAGELAGKL